MGRVDREVIGAHLAALEACLSTLRSWRDLSATDLDASRERLWAVAHGLQIAIQNVLDVSMHLAASLAAGTAPEDYRGAILGLADLGVLNPTFAASIAPLAGLRNVLVHGYLRLRMDALIDALRRLDDFARFAQAITAFLAAQPDL